MSQVQAELLVDCRNELGEGVQWNPDEARLYWTDVYGLRLYRCDEEGQQLESWELPEKLASFAFDSSGDLLAAFASGLFRFRPKTGLRDRLTHFEPEEPNTRLNDGRCDRAGRFIVGGCHEGFYNPVSTVVSYAGGRDARTLLTDVALTNGIAFSKDGRRLYFTDSESLAYHAYAYDPETGELGERTLFALIPRGRGFADGACVASDDSLWSARYYGGLVQQYLPDGQEGQQVLVPTRCVACVCFGGKNLDTLFITTGRKDLGAKERTQDPHAGGLFRARVQHVGLPESRFGQRLF
jgi:L-arabinonolactonase